MRGRTRCLVFSLGSACGGPSGSGGETGSRSPEATGTSTTLTTDTGLESGSSGDTSGGFVACSPVPCAPGAIGCSCRGMACDDADAICERDRCIVLMGDMVGVPEGPFCMGCNAAVDDACVSDERPAHEVWLSSFEIDRTEVTQADFAACVEAGACSIPEGDGACANAWDPVTLPDHPVACTSWAAARDYCAWRGKRLPTEAEWEKAARGIEGLAFPWGDDDPLCELSNFDHAGMECVGETTSVGSYPGGMSPFGAFDMAGNVWERVHDWYGADYYAVGPLIDPRGPDAGSSRVLRGGSMTSLARFLRTSARDGARAPWVTAHNLGFRCARTPP